VPGDREDRSKVETQLRLEMDAHFWSERYWGYFCVTGATIGLVVGFSWGDLAGAVLGTVNGFVIGGLTPFVGEAAIQFFVLGPFWVVGGLTSLIKNLFVVADL